MSAWLLVGVVTWYAGGFVGQTLYCDRPGSALVYEGGTFPWAALDESEYLSGHAQCGDLLVLTGDGWRLEAYAWDAGRLYDYYIAHYGPKVRIVADLPWHLWKLGRAKSGPVTVVNRSALRRALEAEAGR